MSENDPRTRMWAHALDLLTQAENMQRQFFRLGPSRARRPSWEPPVDVVEDGRQVTITVALPGVAPQDVEVLIDGTALVVAGLRRLPPAGDAAVLHRLEIPHGRFERRIELSGAPLTLVGRELANGCLTLTLRKRA
ncbi:MAG: Hsp20/alpha crystallin family protein [Pseudomonadota bacterium]